MRAGEIIERIRHMLKVKDCKHVCLFCEYYDMCKEEAIKVIEEYLELIDGNEIKAMFVRGENNAMMPFPNNSILKDGKIKNRGEKR